ncbi:MAG: PilZ domain-containing protein [Candidatus Omnitrophota bacterium]
MAEKDAGNEKKKEERVQKDLIIQFSLDSGHLPRKWDISTVREIDEKGVSFLANGKFSLGSTLHMLIRIPLRPFEWFEVSGELVGIEELGAKSNAGGADTALLKVTFLDLKDEQKELIRNSGSEKREVCRVEKHLIIQFSLDAGPLPRKWDISTVKDIGEKGVSFLANEKFALGSSMRMLIRIPLRPFEWFEVSGKLVAVEELGAKNDPGEAGTTLLRVTFLDLEETQKELIREYVSWCLKYGGVK